MYNFSVCLNLGDIISLVKLYRNTVHNALYNCVHLSVCFSSRNKRDILLSRFVCRYILLLKLSIEFSERAGKVLNFFLVFLDLSMQLLIYYIN
jgi:hypothetical protein